MLCFIGCCGVSGRFVSPNGVFSSPAGGQCSPPDARWLGGQWMSGCVACRVAGVNGRGGITCADFDRMAGESQVVGRSVGGWFLHHGITFFRPWCSFFPPWCYFFPPWCYFPPTVSIFAPQGVIFFLTVLSFSPMVLFFPSMVLVQQKHSQDGGGNCHLVCGEKLTPWGKKKTPPGKGGKKKHHWGKNKHHFLCSLFD